MKVTRVLNIIKYILRIRQNELVFYVSRLIEFEFWKVEVSVSMAGHETNASERT